MSLKRCLIRVNGTPLWVEQGLSLAAALWEHGIRELGRENGIGRGLYCGIGHCCQCTVTVDGVEDVRACLTPVRDGMKIILPGVDLTDGNRDGL